jgi:hypothetical protein
LQPQALKVDAEYSFVRQRTGVDAVAEGLHPLRRTVRHWTAMTFAMSPVALFPVTISRAAGRVCACWIQPSLAMLFFIVMALVAASLKIANVWQRFVILRRWKLQRVNGAGMFVIIPVFDSGVAVIDPRIQTKAFNAEQAMTRDTVPVNVSLRQTRATPIKRQTKRVV